MPAAWLLNVRDSFADALCPVSSVRTSASSLISLLAFTPQVTHAKSLIPMQLRTAIVRSGTCFVAISPGLEASGPDHE